LKSPQWNTIFERLITFSHFQSTDQIIAGAENGMQIIDPVRIKRSYTQKLRGKPADVLPLLCPVREREWASGWDPLAVYSMSGFAENDSIFTTGEENPESIRVIADLIHCGIE